MTRRKLAALIDHTFLKAAGSTDAVEVLCAEAREYGFACAMVNPAEVAKAAALLDGSGVRVGTVVGFPLGQNTVRTKCTEAIEMVEAGALDIDYVLNIRDLRSKPSEEVLEDLMLLNLAPKKVCDDVVTKLIIECCYLTDDEKVLACRLAKKAGFDFVKTSTGFGSGGATPEDVALMRKTVGRTMGVKAAGGIRTLEDAMKMIEAGANRLGCSAGVSIVEALSTANQSR
ncbi:MAG: deoxyribose-phosphate aldolase [Kiritimatiellae bacterium]|nr:deoxyribose-phosphate aldolase [Kiritimatiellia bacterium]MBR6587051.1 deoxyribose-phosphate aldolase [Kiritimatiellia bacterium]